MRSFRSFSLLALISFSSENSYWVDSVSCSDSKKWSQFNNGLLEALDMANRTSIALHSTSEANDYFQTYVVDVFTRIFRVPGDRHDEIDFDSALCKSRLEKIFRVILYTDMVLLPSNV